MPDIWASGAIKRFVSDTTSLDVLGPIDLAVSSGEFVTVVGPSGCGKTTLLRMLLGLESCTSGHVGIDRLRAEGGVAYVPQHAQLLPWRTMLQNAALGLELKHSMSDARMEFVADLTNRFGLSGFEHYYADKLSGGMKQRTSVIRALASRPNIMLCDEPFSAVDYVERLRLNAEMKHQCHVMGVTTLFVTHSIDEAIFLGQRVIVLTHRPAQIAAVYQPKFGTGQEDPAQARSDPAFQRLFESIWANLRGGSGERNRE
jgi:NitT/TauT family transport system ATP-binding protein